MTFINKHTVLNFNWNYLILIYNLFGYANAQIFFQLKNRLLREGATHATRTLHSRARTRMIV